MTIRYWVAGAGPAVLLVHAGVCDARMWARQVEDLRRDHQVITVDLRGYGETPLAPGTRYSDAGDLLEVLDELGLDSVAVVGASYGGNVVLQAASRRPARFHRLVLLAPPVDGVEPTADLRAVWDEENRLLEAGDVEAATALNVRSFLGPEADDEARALVHTMQKRAFELQLAAGDDLENEEYEVTPAAITAPVKLFCGARDLQFFRDGAEKLAKELPDVEYVELPWAGHVPTLERPAEGVALVRAALG
ncbi:alpha/beta hydrolase fold protein [Kribbella flavida DSM 17836]|uniref:Alpha/beta hydrolase fold protein n=1 Tax=Kribbella flavida (strain DSM 17836 / JCM 10339 / NBRC 14399) TaxID=479435 RepID=D2Q432_KRIFD|nr:alpha/beta hydrolase [Kribbella flavida]ADB30346.1 alpha/beta hydrolase fold protein [Kribbella flavida DSM 17836]